MAFSPSEASETPVTAQRAYERVSQGPAPAWVVDDAPGQAADDAGGARTLLASQQFRVDAQTTTNYRRWVTELVTAGAVAENSQFSVTFNPSHTEVVLHHVRIVRGDEIIDATANMEIEVIRRETDMESRRYDGDYTLIARLWDVRAGDVVDYAFSWVGRHPLFADWRFCFADLAMSWPVARHTVRVNWPGEAEPRWRLIGQGRSLEPAPLEGGGLAFVYEADHPEPFKAEKGAPAWWPASPMLEIADARTWRDVAEWAAPLYALGEPDEEVRALAASFAGAHERAEDRAAAALTWVQDEVRYVAMSYGQGGYRPRPPQLVLQRRFGDCKDKTLLLMALLQELGVRSDPVLVHTAVAAQTQNELPTPVAFNHVIVRIHVDDAVYWVDPTASGQRGPLSARAPFLRGHGLLILPGADEEALQALPDPADNYPVARSVEERVSLGDGPHDPCTLENSVMFLADEADRLRATFAAEGAREMRDRYISFYKQSMTSAEHVGDLEIFDDPDANAFGYRETITAQGIWKPNPDVDGRWDLSYALDEVRPVVGDASADEPRTAPLRIMHPVRRRQVVTVVLPQGGKNWSLDDRDVRLSNPGFTFVRTERLKKGALTVTIEVETHAYEVSAEDAAHVLRDRNAMMAESMIALQWFPNPKKAKRAGTSVLQILFWLGIIGAVVAASQWESLRDMAAGLPWQDWRERLPF